MKRLLAFTLAAMACLAPAGLSQARAQDVQQFDLPPIDVPSQGFPNPEPPAQQEAPSQPDDLPSFDFPAEEDAPSDDQLPPEAPPAEAVPQATPETAPAKAERIQNKVAEFSGIDKITGRITSFDVYVNETVQFGALQVTPRVCYTSAPTEAPQTDSFVEVDEITLDREIRRIFTGWMFSDSPGLNAVEHPVYDVWLKGCKTDSAVPPPAG